MGKMTPHSCLFSALNDMKLISSFMSSGCFSFLFFSIKIFSYFLLWHSLGGLWIPSDQLKAVISFVTLNLLGIQTYVDVPKCAREPLCVCVCSGVYRRVDALLPLCVFQL